MVSERQVEIFLTELAKSPNVSGAAKAAGFSRRTAYNYRDTDPEFAAAWDDAIEQATDNLVGEMYRRAYRGTEKPVYYQGEEVGAIREYSDTLAIFLAKAHRPQVYGDKIKQEITGANGGPVRLAFEEELERAYGERGGS